MVPKPKRREAAVNRKSGDGKRRGDRAPKTGQKKAGASGKKRSRPSYRGTVQKARERAAGLIDPNIHVVVEDELRVQILSVAIQRMYAPSEFARDVGISVKSASYHFNKLEEHGYLELARTEKVRGSIKHYYRATKSGFISEADWGDVADALRPGVAGAILQDFNSRTSQAIETGTLFSRDSATLYWAPADLDEIAWGEQVEFVNWFIEASKQLVVDTANRRANGESDGSFHATVAVAIFPSPTHEEVIKHKGKRTEDKGRRKADGNGTAVRGKAAKKGTAKSKRKQA
jgi:DNA-binding transcriptional ArsR family regulator